MDKLQWFKFNYADWRMGKIQRCSEITQARFLNLCCLYWSKEANLSYEDAEIEIDKEHLDVLLAKKIIERDDEYIFIKFLDEQLFDIAETSKGKSKAAKIRWEKYRKKKANEEQNNADAMHVHKDAMQNNTEKRREEKRIEERESISQKQFLDLINKIRISKGLASNIKKLSYEEMANFKQLSDYNLEDFKKAIINMLDDKWVKENKQGFPKHLLRIENFNKYLNTEPKKELTLGQMLNGAE